MLITSLSKNIRIYLTPAIKKGIFKRHELKIKSNSFTKLGKGD